MSVTVKGLQIGTFVTGMNDHYRSVMLSRKDVRADTGLVMLLAGGLGLLQVEASLHSNNNRPMMKARWRPIEWTSVCCVLWLPWKPLQLRLSVEGLYNWVLLSYHSLWFHHYMTSKSSPHVTTSVSAYLMGSKTVKHNARLVWMTEAALEEISDPESLKL